MKSIKKNFKIISIFKSYNLNLTYSEALVKMKTKQMGRWKILNPQVWIKIKTLSGMLQGW